MSAEELAEVKRATEEAAVRRAAAVGASLSWDEYVTRFLSTQGVAGGAPDAALQKVTGPVFVRLPKELGNPGIVRTLGDSKTGFGASFIWSAAGSSPVVISEVPVVAGMAGADGADGFERMAAQINEEAARATKEATFAIPATAEVIRLGSGARVLITSTARNSTYVIEMTNSLIVGLQAKSPRAEIVTLIENWKSEQPVAAK